MAITHRFRTGGWIVLGGLLILTLSAGQLGAAEKDYPKKMITLINPYAPGGGIDFAYRAIVDFCPITSDRRLSSPTSRGPWGRSEPPLRPKPNPTGTPCSPALPLM